MARNGSGTMTRVSNSFSNPVAGTAIDPSTADALFDDYDAEITNSVAVDGQSTMTGSIKATLAAAGNAAVLTSTDAGASAGPNILLDRNSASPAALDGMGNIIFRGRDSGGNATDYATIATTLLDATNGSEDAEFAFYAQVAGASTNVLSIHNGAKIGSVTYQGGGTLAAAGSLYAHVGTATPAGGTAGAGLRLGSTSNFGIFFGSGVPTLSAAQGSLYLRSDGSTTNNRAYINTDGGTTWTALTTAA